MYARITTDADGRLTADSTCTIDGITVPVPARAPKSVTPDWFASRVGDAVAELGWDLVRPLVDGVAHVGPRYVDLLVDLPGGQG